MLDTKKNSKMQIFFLLSILNLQLEMLLEGKKEIQTDLLNLYSLNLSFLLNSSGKFENFETVTIDTNVKSTF